MGEGHDDLLPAGVVLAEVAGDHFGHPHNIADLLLLELEVGVEDGELVALVEGQGVALALLVVHDVVEGPLGR